MCAQSQESDRLAECVDDASYLIAEGSDQCADLRMASESGPDRSSFHAISLQ